MEKRETKLNFFNKTTNKRLRETYLFLYRLKLWTVDTFKRNQRNGLGTMITLRSRRDSSNDYQLVVLKSGIKITYRTLLIDVKNRDRPRDMNQD